MKIERKRIVKNGNLKIVATVNIPCDDNEKYFSLSYSSWEKSLNGEWDEYMFGQVREFDCYFPEFSDVRALHLSNERGMPLHAEQNGWYWLAGALGGIGEKYHGGNKRPHECAEILRNHMRYPSDNETYAVLSTFAWHYHRGHDLLGIWASHVEFHRPRWNAEAEACRTKHRCDK